MFSSFYEIRNKNASQGRKNLTKEEKSYGNIFPSLKEMWKVGNTENTPPDSKRTTNFFILIKLLAFLNTVVLGYFFNFP